MRKYLVLFVLSILSVEVAFAQEQEQTDSLVRLIYAESGKIDEINGELYRQFIGNARFFHNNTYLLCDTALWNVDRRFIQALGHVQILQDQTYLTSERADYLIDDNLAQFRGSVVQLYDKDNNVLRTRHLDYNTKDSVAVFQDGASMRDKDGQIIESRNGSYDSKSKTFVFTDHVNMFSDSIFVKTTKIVYRSDLNTAFFGRGTDAWQAENMLSANDGWYDRGREVFLFRKDVHVLTPAQEGWSDSLYYYRDKNIVDMLGHAAVMDTTRNVSALAGRIEYVDTASLVTLTRNPAVVAFTEEDSGRDTVWFGADTLIYYTLKMCDVDSMAVVHAGERKKELSGDAVTSYRRKAAEAAAKAAEEAAKSDPNRPPERPGRPPEGEGPPEGDLPEEGPPALKEDGAAADSLAAAPDLLSAFSDSAGRPPDLPGGVPDSLEVVHDSLAVPRDSLEAPVDSLGAEAMPLDSLGAGAMPPDSLLQRADSLKAAQLPPDTTKIGFVTALSHVKMFRRSMQVTCGRLYYCDLDSLVRLFDEPLVWNEGYRQYSADSISVVIRDEKVEKAHLMSNGFIITEEGRNCYDQIRGTELVAYFDSTSALTRFDALGGANAIFFLKENDALATVNKVDSKMLYAEFKDGDIDRIYYFDSPKNDAYPIVQLPAAERELKGFNWQPELRPADRSAITKAELPLSERSSYERHPRADYPQTETYFPGYMGKIYAEIAKRDSLAEVRRIERERRKAEQEKPDTVQVDSLVLAADTLATADSLAAGADSLKAAVDSLPAAKDSLSNAAPEAPDKAELKAQKKAQREKKRQERIAAREARWAEKDAQDAEKARQKAEKKLQRERERKRRELLRLERRREKEQRTLEKYKARYERRKAREEAKS